MPRPPASTSWLRPSHAIGALFVANGLSLPPLLPRFPEIKDTVGADVAAFGLALLGSGVGGILGSALAPRVLRRLGPRRTAVGSALVLATTTLAVAISGSVPSLFVALAAVGVCDGVADTAQNHLLFDEQRRTPSSLTSRMHALWSIGALVGTAVGTLAVGQRVGVVAQTVGVAVVAGTLVLLAGVALRRTHRPAAPAGVAASVTAPSASAAPSAHVGRGSRPSRRAAGRRLGRRWGPVAAAAVTVAAVEGIASEWSALALRDGLGAATTLAAAGPTAFAGAMLAGRVVGDRVIDRVGLEGAARLGGVVVAVGGGAGLLGAMSWDRPVLLVLGLVAAGVGAAVLFPAMLASGDRRDASGTGLAVASAAARAGFLTVPVAMGALASVVGLGAAFWLLPGAGMLVAVLLPRALREGGPPSHDGGI